MSTITTPEPTNPLVSPLLTDLYQLTMAYGYWLNGRHETPAVFDLFYRKPPFGGAFAVFAGLEEVIRLMAHFQFTEPSIAHLDKILPTAKHGFWDWLKSIDCSRVKVYALHEGTLAFPHVPLIRVEGPLATVQLLETAFLNLVGYPTLMATNAARFRLTMGMNKQAVEFGLRRAQGPDGGLSASRYSYLGGFEGTSNVLASVLDDIPIKGTMAHAYIQSYSGLEELQIRTLDNAAGQSHDFVEAVLRCRQQLGFVDTNEGELAAFISYAIAFPRGFLALVDTYNTLQSGVPNFLCVALALSELGYQPLGIRLDSGDLSHTSIEARRMFREIGDRHHVDFESLTIVASNDINVDVLTELNLKGHQIDVFGIGTHLVTCQDQPALGPVYKLVEINGHPRIKLSEDPAKITLPGRKEAYRLIGHEGYPLLDLMIRVGAVPPQPGARILARHPFIETKMALVLPQEVIPLHRLYWDGEQRIATPSLSKRRAYVLEQLAAMRPDHLRFVNPTPYKVSVSDELYDFLHGLMETESPITELR